MPVDWKKYSIRFNAVGRLTSVSRGKGDFWLARVEGTPFTHKGREIKPAVIISVEDDVWADTKEKFQISRPIAIGGRVALRRGNYISLFADVVYGEGEQPSSARRWIKDGTNFETSEEPETGEGPQVPDEEWGASFDALASEAV